MLRAPIRLWCGLAVCAVSLGPVRAAGAVRGEMASIEPAAPGSSPAEERTARDYYYEGEARYSAADYVGAIESFTLALAAVSKDGATPRMRSSLLLNLAGAHVKAFEAGPSRPHARDHLVAAVEIYDRLGHESSSVEYPSEHVEEAARHADDARSRLAAHDEALAFASKSAGPPSPTVRADGRDSTPPRRGSSQTDEDGPPRGPGRTLLVTGAAATGLGIAAIIYGVSVGPMAKRRAEREGRDDDTSDKYVDTWEQRGRIVLGTGAGVAALGSAALVTGVVLLLRERNDDVARHTLFVPQVTANSIAATIQLSF